MIYVLKLLTFVFSTHKFKVWVLMCFINDGQWSSHVGTFHLKWRIGKLQFKLQKRAEKRSCIIGTFRGFLNTCLYSVLHDHCCNYRVYSLIQSSSIAKYKAGPFWLYLFSVLLDMYHFSTLAKDNWRGFSTRNAHMVHIFNLIRFILVEVSFYISEFRT